MGVSAVVLAAGRSARMGETKQLLRLGGRSMLQRTLENVRASGAGEVVLVLGFAAEEIQREIPVPVLSDVRIAINPDFASGLASSIRAGLAAVSPAMDAALMVLADQPFVRAETMGRILECHRSSGAKIVVPYYHAQRGNPVLLNRSLFAEGMRLKGDVGCRAIFENHADEIARVEVDDPAILMDFDTREDYEQMRGRLPD